MERSKSLRVCCVPRATGATLDGEQHVLHGVDVIARVQSSKGRRLGLSFKQSRQQKQHGARQGQNELLLSRIELEIFPLRKERLTTWPKKHVKYRKSVVHEDENVFDLISIVNGPLNRLEHHFRHCRVTLLPFALNCTDLQSPKSR